MVAGGRKAVGPLVSGGRPRRHSGEGLAWIRWDAPVSRRAREPANRSVLLEARDRLTRVGVGDDRTLGRQRRPGSSPVDALVQPARAHREDVVIARIDGERARPDVRRPVTVADRERQISAWWKWDIP